MSTPTRIRVPWLLACIAVCGVMLVAQDKPAAAESKPATSGCLSCHADPERFEEKDRHFMVSEKDFAADYHWQRGLRCEDCHGGNPKGEEYADAHSQKDGFRAIKSPADVPGFCGRCHSDIEFMRKYKPSPRTDQVAEYWTSGHGKRLKESADKKVATCVSCHGSHGIKAVEDLASPVYATNVATTCGKCHADTQRMAGVKHHDAPLPTNQLDLWQKSVHGVAMLKKGDVSAPTCNDCHGNHGAVPPEVGSVANACGTCHGKIAELFSGTRMKHQFEEVKLPGCATCHGYHDIHKPSDEMIGTDSAAVCAKCHNDSRFGAPASGAKVAEGIRGKIEGLKSEIAVAEGMIADAERRGMEVRTSRFELVKARGALTNARSLVHTFSAKPVDEAVAVGRAVTDKVKLQANAAMDEYTARRVWLVWSLALILVVIGVLVVVIRRMPLPVEASAAKAG